jgi:hypothetical protein
MMLSLEYALRKIVSAFLDELLGKTSLTYDLTDSNLVEKKSY